MLDPERGDPGAETRSRPEYEPPVQLLVSLFSSFFLQCTVVTGLNFFFQMRTKRHFSVFVNYILDSVGRLFLSWFNIKQSSEPEAKHFQPTSL